MFPDTNAAWTFPHTPRAKHVDGVTYLGYVDSTGSINALAYDHAEGTGTEAVLNDNILVNDHIAPTVFNTSSGDVLFPHARGATGGRQRRAPNGDVSDVADREMIVSGSINYPTPVQTDSGVDLYHRQDTADQWRLDASDDARRWDNHTRLTDFENRAYLLASAESASRYYLAIVSTSGTRISELFVIYREGGAYYETDGTQIAADDSELPLQESDLTGVYDSGDTDFGSLWAYDIEAVGTNDVRVLLADASDTTNHEYYEARWDGVSWTIDLITSAGPHPANGRGYYSGGLCYAGNNVDTIYLSQDVNGTHEIFAATKSGGSWSLSAITDGSSNDQWRPVRVKNGTAELPCFWLEIETFNNFEDYEMYAQSELSEKPIGEIQSLNRTTSPYQTVISGSGKIRSDANTQ